MSEHCICLPLPEPNREDCPIHGDIEHFAAENAALKAMAQSAEDDCQRAIERASKLRHDLKCLEESTVDRKAYDQLKTRVEELEGATTRLVKTSRLLHENCVGCAIDHHYLDFQEQGLPGWLADSETEIAQAEAALANKESQS